MLYLDWKYFKIRKSDPLLLSKFEKYDLWFLPVLWIRATRRVLKEAISNTTVVWALILSDVPL